MCSYVTPLSAGRLLDSPRHAARFVSLIPYTKVDAVGSGNAGSGRMDRTAHGAVQHHAEVLAFLV